MSILQTIDLKKYYGTEPNITRALNGVNFTVEQGEFVAVVGTSGSGKSTLLHMMGGLDTPTSGSVIVRGEELAKKNDDELTIFRRRNIGFIFQNYNLVPILNVYENIVLPVELDGDTVDQKFMDEGLFTTLIALLITAVVGIPGGYAIGIFLKNAGMSTGFVFPVVAFTLFAVAMFMLESLMTILLIHSWKKQSVIAIMRN